MIISNFFENSRRYSQVKVHHYTGGKFAIGINDTGAAVNFFTGIVGVVDTGGPP
jgi:hypothetical protein